VAEGNSRSCAFDFNWLTATGTGCFIAAILAGLLLGLGPGKLLHIFGRTLVRLRFAIVAMTCMLGLGYVTRYSGMDAVLGLAFTTHRLGFFPFFGTFIGWLGVALTGSDTSSNVLFGGLQKITAQQLHLSPHFEIILMCATNSAGGVMGKMIDAQSICIATAATTGRQRRLHLPFCFLAFRGARSHRRHHRHDVCLRLPANSSQWVELHPLMGQASSFIPVNDSYGSAHP